MGHHTSYSQAIPFRRTYQSLSIDGSLTMFGLDLTLIGWSSKEGRQQTGSCIISSSWFLLGTRGAVSDERASPSRTRELCASLVKSCPDSSPDSSFPSAMAISAISLLLSLRRRWSPFSLPLSRLFEVTFCSLVPLSDGSNKVSDCSSIQVIRWPGGREALRVDSYATSSYAMID